MRTDVGQIDDYEDRWQLNRRTELTFSNFLWAACRHTMRDTVDIVDGLHDQEPPSIIEHYDRHSYRVGHCIAILR